MEDTWIDSFITSCSYLDGIEGVLTWCFFVLFVLTRRQPLRVESV